MKQINVLGAGISGLTAAINLAKAGYSVKVFEKNADVGLSHKLDFEGLENWTCDVMETIKGAGIKTNFKNKPFYDATWYSPTFRKAEIKSKNPFFYMVERGGKDSVEYALKEQAIDAGVEFEFNTKKTALDCDIVSVGAKNPEGVAFGTVFEGVLQEDKAIGVLSDNISPRGYFYVLVWGGMPA
jgi:flavin-dependent dehydrogenase